MKWEKGPVQRPVSIRLSTTAGAASTGVCSPPYAHSQSTLGLAAHIFLLHGSPEGGQRSGTGFLNQSLTACTIIRTLSFAALSGLIPRYCGSSHQ